MKELRRNMRLIGALVVVAFLGLGAWFALTVFEQGSIWASNSYNTRLNATAAQRGDILDRDGEILATTKDGARVYPENETVRRALAVTVGDTAGMSGTGVEGFYSSQLLDISDSLLSRLSALFHGESRKGSSIELTIDGRLTALIASKFPSGYRGAVCVTNWRTGEVLAWVSKPDYDPLLAGTDQVEDTSYLNRCLQGLYTPGSVFKIITLTSALENDPNVTAQTFLCSGEWAYEGGSIVCASRTAHGVIDLQTAFMRSCNVTFGKLAYQLGLDRLRRTAEAFGFNESFKFGDFAIYNSQFPEAAENMNDLVWAGIGQGRVLVTPMHMCMIASTVANGGEMMRPWLVKRVTNASGAVTRVGSAQVERRVMSEETALTIAKAMYAAVQSGTAARAAIDGVPVCGKTGSAEVSDDKSVETNAWYVGFIADPAHPYAVSVVIEQGGAGSRMASEMGATALRAAMEQVDAQ